MSCPNCGTKKRFTQFACSICRKPICMDCSQGSPNGAVCGHECQAKAFKGRPDICEAEVVTGHIQVEHILDHSGNVVREEVIARGCTYDTLATFPRVLRLDGRLFVFKGWNSDKQEAYFKAAKDGEVAEIVK